MPKLSTAHLFAFDDAALLKYACGRVAAVGIPSFRKQSALPEF
ncbi:MAG: hypothetical protein OXI87_21075 [Albidovulum sp.]|nr:hypothetical protein [Albidovulum sp.]MDE0531681.1 hypothetical protein [Albidovulum sp.]